ncbi:MAG: hypothetical protein IT377_33140 [Polyangiaceae bacterium]|nr:hypothetical protein [Polyangiaceae bacterium]
MPLSSTRKLAAASGSIRARAAGSGGAGGAGGGGGGPELPAPDIVDGSAGQAPRRCLHASTQEH